MKRIVISATAILLAAFLVLSTVPAVFAANTEPLDIFTGPEADSASSSAPDTASSGPGLSPIELGNLVTGVWEGSVPIFTSEKTYFNDRVTFDFNTDREEDLLLRFRSLDPDTFFPPNEWRAEGGAVNFALVSLGAASHGGYLLAFRDEGEAACLQGLSVGVGGDGDG